MAKKFQQLIDTGGRQIATNTSSTDLLLGNPTENSATPADTLKNPPGNASSTSAHAPATPPDDIRTREPDGATSGQPSNEPADETHTGSNPETAHAANAAFNATQAAPPATESAKPPRRRSNPKQRTQPRLEGIERVLELLPEPENVLLTGVEPTQPVRDLTYEIPEKLYLEFRKMKHTLTKHSQRRVTNPALCETALALLPETTDELYSELSRLQHVIGLGDPRMQRRRLTSRVAEHRYEQLHDSHLELLLAGHGDIPISALWALSLALLHEALETPPS